MWCHIQTPGMDRRGCREPLRNSLLACAALHAGDVIYTSVVCNWWVDCYGIWNSALDCSSNLGHKAPSSSLHIGHFLYFREKNILWYFSSAHSYRWNFHKGPSFQLTVIFHIFIIHNVAAICSGPSTQVHCKYVSKESTYVAPVQQIYVKWGAVANMRYHVYI